MADLERVRDRQCDEPLGLPDGLEWLGTPREVGRDRGREDTPAAVCVLRHDALRRDLDHSRSVAKNVSRVAVRVAALDHRDASAQGDQVARRLAAVVKALDAALQQDLGFGNVGSEDSCERDETLAEECWE